MKWRIFTEAHAISGMKMKIARKHVEKNKAFHRNVWVVKGLPCNAVVFVLRSGWLEPAVIRVEGDLERRRELTPTLSFRVVDLEVA